MTEEEYQFSLRELPPVKLVQIVNHYRDELKSCVEIFKDYAENNFAQEPLHKYVSAKKAERVRILIEDLKQVIPEWYKRN